MRPVLTSVSVAPPDRPPGPHKHREVMPDAFTVGEASTLVENLNRLATTIGTPGGPELHDGLQEMRAVRHGRDDVADRVDHA